MPHAVLPFPVKRRRISRPLFLPSGGRLSQKLYSDHQRHLQIVLGAGEKIMTTPAVEFKKVFFRYESQWILKNVSFEIAPCDFVTITGRNGGGKSTLLHLILGLYQPNAGNVRIFGLPPLQNHEKIGYVPQDVNANKNFPITVRDVVRMGRLRLHPNEKLVDETLETVGMQNYAGEKISALSQGQRQRVLIARSLVMQPKILVLDEPAASIDAEGQKTLSAVLERIKGTMTVLVVSPDLELVSGYTTRMMCVDQTVHFHNTTVIPAFEKIEGGCTFEKLEHRLGG